MKIQKVPPLKPEIFLAGSALIAAIAAFVNLPGTPPTPPTPNPSLFCQEMVLPKAELGGEALAKLLTIPEPSERSKVQEVLKQPYCKLPALSIRAGSVTEREAYPLAFDPQTWLVILYEGDNYVGYGFKRF